MVLVPMYLLVLVAGTVALPPAPPTPATLPPLSFGAAFGDNMVLQMAPAVLPLRRLRGQRTERGRDRGAQSPPLSVDGRELPAGVQRHPAGARLLEQRPGDGPGDQEGRKERGQH